MRIYPEAATSRAGRMPWARSLQHAPPRPDEGALDGRQHRGLMAGWPVIDGLLSRATRRGEALEELEIGGWAIRPSTQVYLYQWASHMNPVRFERPEEFLPSRWTPELEASLPRCAYTPFGGGPRVCIGNHFAWAELVVTLAAALSRYELHPVKPFRPRLLLSITARPKDPIPMRVEHITRRVPLAVAR